MKQFDNIKLSDSQCWAYKLKHKGKLSKSYQPFQNLNTNKGLGNFTTKKLQFDKNVPVDIQTVEEYDGSVNLIINDDVQYPKLINSRFSVQENQTFNIPEHYGNAVTNIYDENSFRTDSQLLKLYQTIPSLTYNGLFEGGKLSCGSYVFYFKFGDADGNLTNIVQESGIVQVHIGKEGTSQIRMGLSDENSQKAISFTLNNIDNGFDYVRVFYERSSSDQSQAIVHNYYMIDQQYPVQNKMSEIYIDGSETIVEISKSDIQNEFADIQSVKTQEIAHNILFFGNVSSFEQDYQSLQKIAWKIIPRIKQIDNDKCGSIIYSGYSEAYPKGLNVENQLAYYNTKNIYNYVGYWPDEYYRFGIVFIYDNNILSPVFNIQGIDFQASGVDQTDSKYYKLFFQEDSNRTEWDSEPDDYIFNKKYLTNSKGVIRTPKLNIIGDDYQGILKPRPISIEFDFSCIGYDNADNTKTREQENYVEVLRKFGIKGFFFVRQKRIPTILAQGMIIGLTSKDHGALPVIQNEKGQYISESFLKEDRLLGGHTITDIAASPKALLVPDYEMHEATFNSIFAGNTFTISKIGSTEFTNLQPNHYTPKLYENKISDNQSKTVKLTGVPKDTKIISDGTSFFSTLAGNEYEAYKTSDVKHSWNSTKPQDLTVSTSLVRGRWGTFVGINTSSFAFGDIVNIKLEVEDPESQNLLEFEKRFRDYSLYSAIGDRKNISDLTYTDIEVEKVNKIQCFRGDCYINAFTHRMMTNFIDPELPTNKIIIDPATWGKNYLVRASAITPVTAHSNLTRDNEGYYIDDDTTSFANEIVQAFETHSDKLYALKAEDISDFNYNLVNPESQEKSSGIKEIFKSIFKPSNNNTLRGLASINRADVNSVPFGEWITFPVCSSSNYAMRDIDFSQATEEASLNKKRQFYPLEKIDVYNQLLDSDVINQASSKSLSENQKTAFRTIPYIKQEYFNRIYWSKPNVAQSFINSYRFIFDTQYREYNKEFGAITKLLSTGDNLFVAFQHGLGLLSIQRNPQNDAEQSPYLASNNVLPPQVSIISSDYGSMWKDSVIKTPNTGMIYGVDTVAKKIWRYGPNGLEFISDHKVSKFLNDNINLSEFDFKEYQGHINVKTHYNEFKHDVIFTFYKDIPTYKSVLPEGYDEDYYEIGEGDIIINRSTKKKVIKNYEYVVADKIIKSWSPGKTWSLCFNEVSNQFITFYDWYPIESCNVDNIYFSFNKDEIDEILENKETDKFKFIIPVAYDLNGQIKRYGDESLNEYQNFYSENKVLIDQTFGNKIDKIYFTNRLYHIKELRFYENKNMESISLKPNSLYAFTFYLKGEKPEKMSLDELDTYDFNIELNIGNEQYQFDCSEEKWEYKIIFFRTGNNITKLPSLFFKSFTNSDNEINKANFYIAEPKINQCDLEIKLYKRFFDLLPANDIQFRKTVETYKTPFDYYDLRDTQYNTMKLWKHGQAGIFDGQGEIKPTNWYGKQHEFNIEFIVNQDAGIQKVFNNLKIISNKTAPNKFEYEIVGEGYDWQKFKPIVQWINDQVKVDSDITHGATEKERFEYWYLEVLSNSYDDLRLNYSDFPEMFEYEGKSFIKLPFLHIETCDRKGISELNKSYLSTDYWDPIRQKTTNPRENKYAFNTSETIIVNDEQLNEQRVHTEQLGNDVAKYGRLRGNMQYLEDLWDIEIRPIKFSWAYLNINNQLSFTPSKEARHRDKYIKIKVRYSGEDLAVIQSIITMFDYSLA